MKKQKTLNFRLLRKDLKTVEIYRMILSTNILALEELKLKKDYKEWKLLIDNYQSSNEEIELLINNKIKEFKEQYTLSISTISTRYLMQMDIKWYNTLKSTLYIMEDELIDKYQNSVINLWALFFEVDILRKETFVKPLLIK